MATRISAGVNLEICFVLKKRPAADWDISSCARVDIVMLLFVLTVLVVQNELLDETRLAHVLLSKRCASKNNQVLFFKKNFCIYMLCALITTCLIFKRPHPPPMQN